MSLATVDIEDVADLGVNRDIDEHLLPPEAWGMADNMRVQDNVLRRLLGWSQVFGTPGGAPYFLLYVASSAQPWWLYASLTDIFVWDGAVHTNITRAAGGAYGASGARDWNATIHGGIPILNNGVDIPQYWAAYSNAQKMQNLPNWPSTLRARVIRSFGPFLIALNCTDTGVNKPHLIRWSTESDPGTVPVTWDFADATHEAGEKDLPDLDSGIILDGLPLEGVFYIYKENAVWRMRTIGGTFIFDFSTQLLETIGLLATRCVTLTPDGKHHVFATQDDIAMHNGTNVQSLLNSKMRRYLFNQIDTANYKNSFIYSNPLFREVWFCYPQQGSTNPDRAIIFNMDGGQPTEADISYQCAEQGVVETTSSDLWSTMAATWDATTQPWSSSNRRRILLGSPVASKIFMKDSGTTRDGVTFTGTLRRQGLSIIGRDRKGNWIEDFQKKKLFTRLWPKVTGGTISVRVGSQEKVNGPVTWSSTFTYDYTTQDTVDLLDAASTTNGSIEGRAMAVEFSAPNDFTLEGYKIDMSVLGNF